MAKVDPLIAATLKTIPEAGSTRAQRVNWLRRLTMAMNIAYADDEPIDLPDFLGGRVEVTGSEAAPITIAPSRPQLVQRVIEPPRFYIDHAGIARKDPGQLPAQASESDLWFDDRGEFGDLGSILWADGSRGVLGKGSLNISASPALKSA